MSGVDDKDVADETALPRMSQADRRSRAEVRLLDAAIEMIAEKGVERFTMADVGLAAGYSAGLPAHYYGSKEKLISAVVQRITARFTERVKMRPGLEGVIDVVRFYFDGTVGSPTPNRVMTMLVGAGLGGFDWSEDVVKADNRARYGLAALIRLGMEHGSIRRDVDPAAEAAVILAIMRGVFAQWHVNPPGIDIARTRDAYLQALETHLCRRPGGK